MKFTLVAFGYESQRQIYDGNYALTGATNLLECGWGGGNVSHEQSVHILANYRFD